MPAADTTGIATDINNHGVIVGSSGTATGSRPMRWTVAGEISELGQPNEPYLVGRAMRVNDGDEVVGYYSDTSSVLHAAYWSADGTISALDDLLEPQWADWMLSIAYGINSAGQIVGQGFNPAGQPRAFLLTPVPEPASAMLAAGLLAIGRFARPGLRRRIARRALGSAVFRNMHSMPGKRMKERARLDSNQRPAV